MLDNTCAEARASANAICLPVKMSACRDCGAEVASKHAARCKSCSYEARRRPMPDDFPEVAPTMSTDALARHYRAGAGKVLKWLKDIGIQRSSADTRFRARPVPEGFAGLARELTTHELVDRFGVSADTIKRWRRAAGVRLRQRRNFVTRGPGTNIHTPAMDTSLAGRAVTDCLRQKGPIWRCNANGQFNPKGQWWNRGGHVLTDDEVIARAERLGWDRDQWRRLA